jgi:outer membrane protein TolC
VTRFLALLALLAPLAAPAAPLTLDDALAEAGKGSSDLRLARVQRDLAGVDVYGSYSSVLPRLDLNAAFARNVIGAQTRITTIPSLGLDAQGQPVFTFKQTAVETPATSFPDYSLGLRLQQTLYDGGRSWALIEKAKVDHGAAQRQLDEATLSIAFDVTRKFYEVVKAERTLEVLQETMRRSEELLRRAEAMYTAGRGSRADTFAAQVNLGNDRINVETQRVRGASARSDLLVAMGRNPEEAIEVVPPLALDRGAIDGDAPPTDALLARAERARPQLTRLTELSRSADLAVKLAGTEYWPVLGGTLGYSREGPVFAGSDGVYGDPTRQYVATAQLFIQWNLFSGRTTLANEQRAALQADGVRLQREQAARNVAAEISRARQLVSALARSAVLSQDNLVAAEQGVKLAEERFQAGVTTQLEVRDASLKLTQAKLSYLTTRIDLVVARADLNRAVGGAL